MVVGVGFVIEQAQKHQYDPKPLAYATYTVHLGNCGLRGYLAVNNRTYGQIPMGEAEYQRLWALAKSCGGRIEEAK
jgi:hypothetical protein